MSPTEGRLRLGFSRDRCRLVEAQRDDVGAAPLSLGRSAEPTKRRNRARRSMTQYPRPMGSVAAVRAIEPAPANLSGAEGYRQAAPCLSPLRYPGAKRRMVGYVADVLIH